MPEPKNTSEPTEEQHPTDDPAFAATVRRLSKPIELPRINRADALDALLALHAKRTYKAQADREAGIAQPFSLVNETEAFETFRKIAILSDRFTDLTSNEEATALHFYLAAIGQETIKRAPAGRKPFRFPDIDMMRIGAAYDKMRNGSPELTDDELIADIADLVLSGAIKVGWHIAPPDQARQAMRTRIRRAVAVYNTKARRM